VGGVKIIGRYNVPSLLATDASALYSKNLLHFITPLIDPETKELKINWEDEIITGTALTRDGQIIHSAFKKGN
jgi:NAD(P) transhydrogenase subunit alpha